eukprot:TRINITY_DN3491_c0_g1_i2.p1 TRINITY_DN3491_c0_g1~~TRINITY_DN3491_c0_g1_i2.p1  ORF type:complete len:286 (+),score=37.50 TRINITY_DN3491_c0_g1_i2:189-1046(+)
MFRNVLCAVVVSVWSANAADWSYASPAAWHMVDDGYSECRMHQQSPIEIKEDEAEMLAAGFLKIWMPRTAPKQVTVTNNGHGIQVFARQLGITLTAGHLLSQYTLEQVHYHSPSEHVIDGVRYPLERHSVFLPTDAPQLRQSGQMRYPIVVIGEVFELHQDRPDAQLQELINGGLSTAVTDGQSFKTTFLPRFDLSKDEIYQYDGSLTTPPCSEVVQWHVVRTPRTADQDQLQLFLGLTNAMGASHADGSPPPAARYPMPAQGNARPLQATNDRTVTRRRFYSHD